MVKAIACMPQKAICRPFTSRDTTQWQALFQTKNNIVALNVHLYSHFRHKQGLSRWYILVRGHYRYVTLCYYIIFSSAELQPKKF